MAASPKTRYTKSGRFHIAYQVIGDGPIDLVFVSPSVSHLECTWEHPLPATWLERLASFTRLILFDKRGVGMSDRVADHELPTLEERMDDLRAVMDAVGSERAAVFGASEGAAMSVLFAATYPDRTSSLLLWGACAHVPRRHREAMQAQEDEMERTWGDADALARERPDLAFDRTYLEWFAKLSRMAATPGAAVTYGRMNQQIDVREVLPVIRVPTLVLHRTGDPVIPIEAGRYVAERIPDATFIELEGTSHHPWVGDGDSVLGEIEQFLTGARHSREPDRVLATVLFTDIVESTEKVASLGDRAWRALLSSHDALMRKQIAEHRGREVTKAGDGFLAIFDGPARAIRAACSMRDAARRLGVEIRAGLHCGECELIGDDVAGIAVHIGARVAAQAAPGEVLVSSTVKDLVAGSTISFTDHGMKALKGVPGEWHLFAIAV